MKLFIQQAVAVALVTAATGFNTFAQPSAGEVDFARIVEPAKADPYVDIHVGRVLISLAARLVEESQPETAKLLNCVHLVRVNVVGVNDDNRKDLLKSLREVHSQLDKQGWQRVVTVQSKGGEDVRVCLKTRGTEAVEGLFISVLDGGTEAVLINIVGDIKPEQVTALGKALKIEQLEKAGDALKK
jgi:hypothetical protein